MKLARVRLSVADARDLAEGALRGIGYDNEEARIIADHVIDAAMCGYEYSGLAKILNVSDSEHFRLPRRSMKVLRETEVSLAFDGGNNVGMLALFHAAQATIEKTKAHGIALVSVTDAWMSGRSAYYVEMIAKHRLVAIHAAASSPQVAPPGGIRPVLGTNPIAIGVPSSGGPVVFDMGTSAYMMTEVMLRERLGELLPEGVALGPGGEPTRDPAAARRGALLPFGGYKGFGLALMLQALGLLGGSGLGAESEYGYLFVAFRPDLLGPADAFERQVTQLIERIKATPGQPGIDEICIPSERISLSQRASATRARDVAARLAEVGDQPGSDGVTVSLPYHLFPLSYVPVPHYLLSSLRYPAVTISQHNQAIGLALLDVTGRRWTVSHAAGDGSELQIPTSHHSADRRLEHPGSLVHGSVLDRCPAEDDVRQRQRRQHHALYDSSRYRRRSDLDVAAKLRRQSGQVSRFQQVLPAHVVVGNRHDLQSDRHRALQPAGCQIECRDPASRAADHISSGSAVVGGLARI